MSEIWAAFIVVCSLASPTCDGPRTYGKSDKLALSEVSCLEKARSWAVFAHFETGQTYGYGCEKVTYEPRRINP